MAPRPYVEPRPPNTVRVVVVGGSTVQGYPHPRRLTSSAYLQSMLSDAWPDRRVEVYNAGITAVASFAVARTVDEAMALGPDLFVVYTGHNELYGVYGAGSLRPGGRRYWTKGLHYRLAGLSTARAMRLFGGAVTASASGRSASDESLLEVMVAAGGVGPDDVRRSRAQVNLARSLRGMVKACSEDRVPLLLCTLASNETGFAPSLVPGGNRTEADRLALSLRDRLERGEPQGSTAAATDALSRIERQEGSADHALLQYVRGHALRRLGRRTEAAGAFSRARDLDPVPWRATSALNQVIRSVAREEQALLADLELWFRRHAAPSGIGWGLMADHLHPSAAGQMVLARGVIAALADAPEEVRVSESQRARLAPSDEYRRRHGHTPTERLAEMAAMAELFSRPPLGETNSSHSASLARRVAELYSRLSAPEQQGAERWRQGQTTGPLVVAVADQLYAAGRITEAREHYRAAALEEPYTLRSDQWSTMRWGRCIELQAGGLTATQKERVLASLERARLLAASPGFESGLLEFYEGYAWHLNGQHTEALERLERCARDYPEVQRRFTFELLSLLSEELLRAGRPDDAVRYARTVAERVGKAEVGRAVERQVRAYEARVN